MCDFQNYIDTKLELDLKEARYNLLEERKQELFNKYFPTTSKIKDVVVSKTNKQQDNYIQYLHELEKVNKVNNMSIDEEMKYIKIEIEKLKRHLNLMNNILKNAEGMQYELFYMIVCKGNKVTYTIQFLADKYNYAERNVWRTYEKKVKKYIEKLKTCQ